MKTNAAPAAPDFVRSRRQRARGTLLVWALGCAVAAATLSVAAWLGWSARASVAAAPLAVFAGALLIAWVWRSRKLTDQSLARELDERWALKARLEAAVELASDRSALAEAQRADTRRNLAEHAPQRTVPVTWIAGVALLGCALVFLLTEGSFVAWRAWRTHAPSAASVPQPPPKPNNFDGSIVWKSPAPEIKATSIEEVPLAAHIESKKGLPALALEVSVNGEHKLSRPLDADVMRELAKPGGHEIAPSLYLDEVGAQEYDIVSYYLTTDSASEGKQGITSPLQFVQIRPLREDVKQDNSDAAAGNGGQKNGEQMLALLSSLKLAQLQLLQQNFVLAHLPEARGNDDWKAENTRIASEQTKLAAKTNEAREYAIREGKPTLVVDNLSQASPLMDHAGQQIAATANDAAAGTQGHALALLTACEKIFVKTLSQQKRGQSAAANQRNDPFRDEQTFKLPPREQTPAGELEKLAQRQRNASEQLEKASSGAQDQPTPEQQATEQADIARQAEKLAAEGQLDPVTQKSLTAAAKAAAAAAQQLESGDAQAAKEPSAAALANLQAAVTAQEKAGRAEALAQLDQARRDLNEASQTADDAARADKLAQTRDTLRDAAEAQQRQGSAEAARQLAALAKKLSEHGPDPAADGEKKSGEKEHAPEATTAPNSAERASEVAQAAAAAQADLQGRADALNRAVRQLARAEAALRENRGGDLPQNALSDLELAAQDAAWLSGDPATRDLAREVATKILRLRRDGREPNHVLVIELTDNAQKLAVLLEATRQMGQRDEVVRRFNPEDIDPAYRSAVDDYFVRLSRDGAKR